MSDKYNDSYIKVALNPETLSQALKHFIPYIRQARLRFDTVICRGTSGLLVAPSVAMKLKKELVVVRKDDGNHSGQACEGFQQPKRYVIVDDFVCTGATFRTMIEKMKRKYPDAKCVGAFLYRSSGQSEFSSKWSATDGTEIAVQFPCWSMWPESDGRFTFNPEPKAKKLPPATEAEKYFHGVARQPVQAELAIS